MVSLQEMLSVSNRDQHDMSIVAETTVLTSVRYI